MQSLLNTAEAAAVLRVSQAFLVRDRWTGGRIPFIRLGDRIVRYDPEALKRYAESRVRKPTSDGDMPQAA